MNGQVGGEEKASTVTYANLLREHGNADAPAVVAYRERHAGDTVFSKRAVVLDVLFTHKDDVIAFLKEKTEK